MSFIMGSWKILQRRAYDLLSHKYSFVFVLLGFLTLTVSVIQFGEVWIERNQSDNSFSSFRDNVVGKSLQKKLCQILPIDVVYTWVNGSDPLLQQQMQDYKKSLMTTPIHCQLKHCVPSHMAAFRGWGKFYNFNYQHKQIQIKQPDKSNSLLNFTIVTFSSSNDARHAVVSSLDVENNNISLTQAYWTSDSSVPYTYSFPNAIMVTGLSFDIITNFQELPPHHFSRALNAEIKKVWTDIETQVMIMEFQNSPPIDIAKTNSITMFGHKVNISQVYLVLELPPSWDFQDLAPSRFEDKEELRYSIRSLEAFAPWVRHVYLVTNGQIPYWLNLDNPRLTLLTHEDIFPDRTHLPTFSSPAIESHIHRIPGLSRHFLYLNDDVFFGQEVWPDDFITHARGQKVYLSWPVPDCSESCPWSWIGDGSCDISCNVSECAYDGGDCNPSNENIFLNEDFYDDHHMETLDSPLHDHHLVDDSHLDLHDLPSLNDIRRESNETKVLFKLANSSLSNLYSTNHTLESETEGSFDKPSYTEFNYRNIVKVSQKASSNSYFHTKNSSHNTSNGSYTFHRKWNFNRQLKASSTNDSSNTGQTLKDVILNTHLENNLKLKKKGESLPNGYNSKSTGSWTLKKSKDTFAESLLFVNRLYNNEFGYEVRKVPAHMPHLIDKTIMNLLQNRFPVEWKRTSSHKIRNVEDMQYAFSYFYFLMSEKQNRSISEIFDMFDTDKSGTWSDREIRTLLTKLNDLPLNYYKVVRFEEQIINCSLHSGSEHHIATPLYERYQDSKLPVVSKLLISNCGPIKHALLEKFGSCKKYQTEIVKDKNQATTFKMLNSNLSQLVVLLDEIRRDPKKFICLNDNLDPSLEKDNTIVRAVLQDFFESLFPLPSGFELPLEYRNRFLHMSELKAWRSGRAVLRNGIYLCIFCLMIFTLLSFFRIECFSYPKRRVRKIYQDV